MEVNKIMMLPSSTVEDLQKIGRDGTERQVADSGNNAPGKKTYDFCRLLATFGRRFDGYDVSV
jgi:hypothetical protein